MSFFRRFYPGAPTIKPPIPAAVFTGPISGPSAGQQPIIPAQPPLATARPVESKPWGSMKWGYQLQNAQPTAIHNSNHDYMVVDWTRDGKTPWTPADVALMRARSDGVMKWRKVLAYVSIGEAENYRPYWKGGWYPGNPSFVLPRNPQWPDNYPVKFEDPAWQKIALDMLSTAQAAGFDGVYLDKVDVYDDRKMGARGASMMMDFVHNISKTLKEKQPGFLIFPQNADALLVDADYRLCIDGIGREDIIYGEDGDGVANDPDDVASYQARLRRLSRDGKPILAVEYFGGSVSGGTMIGKLRGLQLDTLIPLVARRQLDRLPG